MIDPEVRTDRRTVHRMESQAIYTLRPQEVYAALETSPEGLAPGEVAARQQLYGPNLLVEEARPAEWTRFFEFVSHPMAILLWVVGILAFIVRQPSFGLVVFALIMVNAAFSFWREHRAEQAMQALRKLLPGYALVVRSIGDGSGQEVQVPADALVPGDILVLTEGSNIPADARVVEEYGLRTNNSTLTGDAVPARKSSDASLREIYSELERPNLVFAGTSVFSGTARAVVYATGMLTQFGRIAHLTQAVKEQPSPLQLELAHLTHRIGVIAVSVGLVVFLVGSFSVGMTRYEAFLLAAGIIVAAIPEGLPATVTLSLAMTGQRLASAGVLVKKLSVLETLGTISTICTDKSGTLTQNQMTVREIWVARQRIIVSGVGYEPKGEFIPAGARGGAGASASDAPPWAQKPLKHASHPGGDLRTLLIAGALCNNARLSPPSPGHPQWTSLGDQTEAALRVAAFKGGLTDAELQKNFPRLHELPFDARRKRMSTIHAVRNGLLGIRPNAEVTAGGPELGASATGVASAGHAVQTDVAFVKGAPREILQLCKCVLIDGYETPLDDTLRSEVLAANDEFAGHALRVLALAERSLPPRSKGNPSGGYSPERVERDLTLLGLMAMQDPPRPEVTEAVRVFRQAGIRMVMVTGDYGLTAESFARRIEMLETPDPTILTGAELDQMDNNGLKAALDKEVIFARMAPEHKLRLVAALQERGEVVAVTGDGVNDAPALRKADVGVAMGITGTDVAKEAADIILTTDNFATLVSAIEEGRAVYANVRKFITYIFSSNVPEILPFLATAVFNLPLALTFRQILAIDLGTDMLPALGLGVEKPEPDVMQHPPRRRNRPLVDRHLIRRSFLWLGLIEAILCFSGFFLVRALASPSDYPLLGHFLEVSGLLSLFPQLGPMSIFNPRDVYLLSITVYHAGVVMAQVGNAFACRTETNRGRWLGWLSNPFLLYGIVVEVLIIVLLIYVPFLAGVFNHLPLPLLFWPYLALYGVVLYSLDWLRKSFWRKVKT